ncbi:hypothetical protein A6R68_17979 [Neotoma lepida]|uniref:Claudin n=1 Tax=Neotoma lepida TaxID=56216 RepID=A0A1A6HCD0_NEOLE|nr:hypothetical protein A6R68_17979 [Neotoma lepida]
MTRQKLEEASFSLAVLAWIGTIVCSELPKWCVKKMSEHIVIWEGLWKLFKDDGLHGWRCMPYNSHLLLSLDLQVSRVRVVICIIISSMGLLLYMIGDKLITCGSNINNEEMIKMLASGLFLGECTVFFFPSLRNEEEWHLKDESSLSQLQGGPVSKDSSTLAL